RDPAGGREPVRVRRSRRPARDLQRRSFSRGSTGSVTHTLVIANETAASRNLLETLRGALGHGDLVTVIAPVNAPASGYVVYEDTRRAAAGRRLDQTLRSLQEAGIPAHGFVV